MTEVRGEAVHVCARILLKYTLNVDEENKVGGKLSHSLGGLKTVSIQGQPETDLPLGLEVSRMSLQDYFISLQEATEREEERA